MVGVPALRTMSDGGFRHLPVVENGRIWGIVSRGDFRGLEIDQLDEEDHLRASADGLVGTRPCTAENNRVDLAYPSETGHHAEIRTHRHLATTPDSPAICRLGGEAELGWQEPQLPLTDKCERVFGAAERIGD